MIKHTMERKEINSWNDIENIKSELLRGIYAYGFENPSPIQRQAILPALEKKDLIAQAQSGTGKTGAFTISALQLVNTDEKRTQILIMSPTRELSTQTFTVLNRMGSHMDNLKTHLLIGGNSIDADTLALREQPHIIVGCPGRVHDMIRRNKINASNIDLLIIDEADEMLSSGFKEQVYNIFQCLKSSVQVALFSATLPSEVQELSSKFMRDPEKILVKSEALTLEGIKQYYIAVESDAIKYDTLKDLYNCISAAQSIIYCNSIRRVEDLAHAMLDDGFAVSYIHGKMTPEERTESFQGFKTGSTRVLISSNLTARGIDVQQVSTVINFDIPRDVHSYLHRIGRSGRWGRKGMGINFVSRFDIKMLKEIEGFYSTQIEEMPSSIVEHEK
jgi:translation initiation factor 4A